jgi:hypothetical protein
MNCMRIMGAPVALLLGAFVLSPAEAYHVKHHHHYRHHGHDRSARTADDRSGGNPFTAVRRARQNTRQAARQDARYAGYRQVGNCTLTNDGRRICRGPVADAPVLDADGNRTFAMANESRVYRNRRLALTDEGSIIGSRPSGCPHAYCGCGLRKFLGLSDVRLNLASNWARYFPHESGPRAGLAAVRNHHVMYIESSAGNGQWIVRDYNSGGGMSRVHTRDVRGYVFVNPHAVTASR